MVAATSADACLSLEAIGDAEAPDVVGWPLMSALPWR